jgi:Zn-dependent protease
MFNLDLPTLISRVIILVVAFTVHELAHAWTADWFGDDTPRRYGRLTLNPLAHLDPIGSLLLLVAGFGWAKPVPVNPYTLQRRSYYAPMWVALAGPASNLILALIAAIPFQIGVLGLASGGTRFLPSPSAFALEFILLNLALTLFNLIPIFPLDGEKILVNLAPRSWGYTLEQIRPYGPLLLITVVFVGPYLGLDLLNLIVWRPVISILSFLVRPGLTLL